jgi:cell pole-organizing protein PopZ
MAQPNVAREPSMDEILASIRKIIENNEAQPEFGDGGKSLSSFHIATSDEPQDMMDDEEIVAEFHAEEDRSSVESEPMPRVEANAGAQPALSLADVAARVRAASERHISERQGGVREPENREPAVTETVSIAAKDDSPRESSPVVTSRMAANAGRIPLQAESTAGERDFAEAKIETAPVVELPRLPDALTSAIGRDVAALVSPAVGERVAQSFGALAQAVDAGPRRSFDEIAEEMMRPMLQEWLDDNLPTLVERLVREEIERVARGPRR